MNKSEFVEAAARERIDSRAYSLDGGLVDNALCVDTSVDGSWVVYFSERGSRWDERSFDTEFDALEYMLAKLVADPSVRLRELDD